MEYYKSIVSHIVATNQKKDFKNGAKVLATLFIGYYLSKKLYCTLSDPLSCLPGPLSTRFVKIPRWILDRPRGTIYQYTLKLHDVYGPIVRAGPKMISIADKNLIREVLFTLDLPKGRAYKLLRSNDVHTLFSTDDPVWHKQRRHIILPAFSIKYLKSLEPLMKKTTETFVHKIEEEIERTQRLGNAAENTEVEDTYGTVDIWNLVQRLAIDVIGETAFGKSFCMLENNEHFIPAAIKKQMKRGAFSVISPLLASIVFGRNLRDPRLVEYMTGVIEDRLKNKNAPERKDILQLLINSQQAENSDDRLTTAAIIEETNLFLVAGSETTSNTIGFVIIELLNYPDKLKKLIEEIDSVEVQENQIVFQHDQVKHLPYLNAVINETLRIDSVVATPLPRVTVKPTVIGNITVPANTEILCNILHAHLNEEYWPNALEFRPERWIDEGLSSGEGDSKNGQDTFFTFSIGSRSCIGRNFALQEMRIVLATLLKNFEIKPIQQELEDAKHRRAFLTLSILKDSFKIRVRRRVQ